MVFKSTTSGILSHLLDDVASNGNMRIQTPPPYKSEIISAINALIQGKAAVLNVIPAAELAIIVEVLFPLIYILRV